MKRILAACLIFCMCFGFCACGATPAEKTETPTTIPEETTEPVVLVPVLSEIKIEWVDNRTYTVGKELQADEYGRITRLKKRYDTIEFTYNDINQVVKATITDNDDGTVGFENFNFEGLLPTSSERDLNDGFTNIKNAKITTKQDEAGRVTQITEQVTYKDPENGKKSKETNKYDLKYDEAGRVASVTYSSDGKVDHTTNLIYDRDGTLLSYANQGSSGNVYLKVEFGYTMVDQRTVTPMETDPLTVFLNWENMINHIL